MSARHERPPPAPGPEHGDAGRRKRGRPPRLIPSSDGTKKTHAQMGITRQQLSDWQAMASIPKDVFEERLESPGKHTTAEFVRFACELGTTNRKAPMHDPTPVELAHKAIQRAREAIAKLSPDERLMLACEMFA